MCHLRLRAVARQELKGTGGDETQYEISVDCVPRSYRDRKELALQGARFLKSRNPNSVVKLKDLQTGDQTAPNQ